MTRTLIIFARAPRLGRVKRRLAEGVGDLAALRFHRLNTETLIRRLAPDRRWRTVLAATPEGYRWPEGLPRIRQSGSDLGARMCNAIRAMPRGPVVLIGSDIPAAGPTHIARAFRALAGCQVVFGPAPDGGYWLVGVRDRSVLGPLFGHVRWSTRHALADTLANLGAHVSHALVDPLEDVDSAQAFKRWRETPLSARQASRSRGISSTKLQGR